MRLAIPHGAGRWAIRGTRVPAALLDETLALPSSEGLVAVDLVVEGDRIAAVLPAVVAGSPAVMAGSPAGMAGSTAGMAGPGDMPFVAAGGALVLPCFVDAHTHLDKGHSGPRTPNPDGTFPGALAAVAADRAANWTAADVRTRMDFALRCAHAHGTAAIRTHIDSVGPQTRISWPVFAELRDLWRDRIDLQASPLYSIDLALDDANFAAVVDMVGAFGGVLGAVTVPGPALRPGLDRIFRTASERGWDLDFHADETGDPTVNSLALIAETALRFGFEGRILAGHCCSLAVMPEAERDRTIELVARAGLAVVSLPMCNMYLQGRGLGETAGQMTPRWRGVTAFKELHRAGVPVMVASDNIRDPFYAYGDLDMAEVWREGTRILHLDHPFGDWAATVARTPAAVMRRPDRGVLRAGGPADFILFAARSLSEWMARPQVDRTVVRAGRPIAGEVPSYAELDHLRGLRP